MRIIIPFRMANTRFPNKPTVDFMDQPLIYYAMELGMSLDGIGKPIVTSSLEDYHKVEELLLDYDYEFMRSSETCKTATDRVVEIFRDIPDEYFVVLPINEPLLDVNELDRIIHLPWGGSNTLYCDFINIDDMISHLSAKMILNRDSKLMYMSHSVIPILEAGVNPSGPIMKKNVGVSLFDKGFLEWLDSQKDIHTVLDKIEGLEQLRWLELGATVKAIKIKHIGFGLDIPEQLGGLKERAIRFNVFE